MSLTRESHKHQYVRPFELAMIADDLAGACDTGVEFLPAMGAVTVIIDSDNPVRFQDLSENLMVWNTESRSLLEGDAYRKVRRACTNAIRPETRILLKKADSAFRGHYGREIAAIMDAWPPALVGLLPAIPEFGRVTRNGVQYLDGVPIAESFYRRDPRHPVTESRVAVMASRGNPRPIGLLALDAVRSPNTQRRLETLIASNTQIIVADSETQEDLERVAASFLNQRPPVVLVGGQGMGRAVAQQCQPRTSAVRWRPVPQGAIVIVCGSLHPRTRQQLHHVAKTYGVEPAYLPSDVDWSPQIADGDAGIDRVLDQIAQSGVGVFASPEHILPDPILVETALAHALVTTYQRTPVAGMILTGGATSYAVCRQLGVKQLQLRQRIGFGVVVAQIPEMAGAAMGIKGGSLGDVEAITRLVEILRSVQGQKGRALA